MDSILTMPAESAQPTPCIQIADKVVDPQHERRDDWWIISRIEQEMGLPSLLDQGENAGDDLLKMISLRTNYMHNSNLANMRSLKRGDKALTLLHIHPADAAARHLEDGAIARIVNEYGSVTAAITHDDDLLPGVVALSRANGLPGVNANRLLPSGAGTYEPISNMSHMNGVVVRVERDADAYKLSA